MHMCNRLRWRRWLRRCWRRCRRLGRRFLSGRCLAQMLRDDLACTLRALTGDLQGEVRQLLRRQPQRTGAEVAARAAIGVRIFQHVREGRHRANSSIARPLPPRVARCQRFFRLALFPALRGASFRFAFMPLPVAAPARPTTALRNLKLSTNGTAPRARSTALVTAGLP